MKFFVDYFSVSVSRSHALQVQLQLKTNSAFHIQKTLLFSTFWSSLLWLCFPLVTFLVRCCHFTADSHCWLGLSTSTTTNVQHCWRNVTWSWHATVSLSRFRSLQSCVLVPIPVRWASLFKQWGARPSFKSWWHPTEPVDSSTLPIARLCLEVRPNT